MSEVKRERPKYMVGSVVPQKKNENQSKPTVRKKARKQPIPRTDVRLAPKAHVGIVAILCAIVLVNAFFFVQATSEVKILDRQISKVQADITDYQKSNKDAEDEITQAMDLNEIKKIATEKLGMKPIEESQVRTYNKTEREYVRQNANIPEN
ncbi:hypothetical protein P261_00925 [Lachnospiraceae bacterium TWA4]|nr:hypothetical protein P261_00925 [Lachnospiraceae bacterium TWA4]